MTHVRDASGDITETEYDNAGRPVRVRAPWFTNPGVPGRITPVSTREYDRAGDLVKETDPAGGVTDYRYHWTGELAEVSGPAVDGVRPVTRLAYNDADELVSRTDPTGAVVEFAYDGLGRQVATTEVVRQPAGAPARLVTTVTYNDVGEVLIERNAAGNTTRYVRDGAGRVIEVWLPDGARPTRYSYYPDGELLSETGPSGRAVFYDRDTAGRVDTVRHHDANGWELSASRSRYDAAGNVVETRTPLDHATTYTYDALSRLRSITQFPAVDAPISTTGGYDAVGNLVRVTDGNNNSTWTGFTPDGAPQRVVDPATSAHPEIEPRVTHYDARGLPVAEFVPGGVGVRNTFDALGRLTAATGTAPDTAEVTSRYGYDLADRLTSVDHPQGTQAFTWSDRGNLTGSSGPAGTASFSYDAVGLVIGRTDAAGTATFGYYGDGRMSTATEAHTGQRRNYIYNGQSAELVAEVTDNGWRTDWGRDAAGRVDSVRTTNPSGGAEFTIGMTYDRDGNVVARYDGGATAGGGSFAYDGAGRMTGWTGQDGQARRFAYDGAGNRLSESVVGADGSEVPARRWSYDARNQPTEMFTRQDNGEPDRRTTFAYDARGALRTRVGPPVGEESGATETRQVRFDGLDRMVRDGDRTYSYDGLGRVAQRNAGPAMGYAGLEEGPTVDGPVTYARDTEGDVRGARRGTAAPVAAVGDVRGDIVGWRPMTTTANPPQGFLGSVGFSPYGERRSQSGEQYGIGYQGEWTDPDSGLVKMGVRWYEPTMGAFTSRDPYDQGLAPATVLNRHAYAGANPLRYVDPTGMFLQEVLDGVSDFVSGVEEFVGHAVDCLDVDDARNRSGQARGKAVFATANAAAGRLGSLRVVGQLALPGVVAAACIADQYQQAHQQVVLLPHVTPLPKDPPSTLWDGEWRPPKRDPRVVAPKPSPPPVVVSQRVETRSAGSVERGYVNVLSAPGMRGVQAGVVTEHFAQDRLHTDWSNGRREWTGWSPPYLHSITDERTVTWVLTNDPMRLVGESHGSVAAGAGVAGTSAEAHDFGECGLSGTVQSCLDEVRMPVLGGGCAGLTSSQQACVPTEPVPGLPGGQRENTATVQLPSTGTMSPQSCAANSFTPETLVVMADGARRPIALVRVGDEVLATDPMTGQTEARPVTALITGDGVKDLVEVTVDIDGPVGSATGAVVATDGHPFWVDDQGRWVDAGDLRPGDDVQSADGATRDVVRVRAFRAVQRVHNLTVDGIHTYYVVADGAEVLTHNSGKCGDLGDDWIPRGPNKIGGSNDCETCAEEIVSRLGGGERVWVRPTATRYLPQYRGRDSEWWQHNVVVKDGKVYDAFGDRYGTPIAEWKRLWDGWDEGLIDFGGI